MRYAALTALAGLALALATAPPSRAQGMEPVMYVTQYQIQTQRLDSLSTLIARYDIPWHAFIAANVPGYQRQYYRHDTGDEHNLMIVTTYPDWDMVRGDEIPFDALFPGFATSMGMTTAQAEAMGVDAMFDWAYEGSTHVDQIWRPITAEDDD